MSSLFSIGEDELDLDDEDCLLAACGVGSLDNSKTSGSNKNISSSKPQLLRSKEVAKLDGHHVRQPFESISNMKRACDQKRTSTEQIQRSYSINLPKTSTTSTASGLNMPVAKRLAIDSTYNSSPKASIPENGGNLLHSSSMPTVKNTDNSSFSKSSLNPQLRELGQCNFETSNCGDLSKNMDSSNTLRPDSTNMSRLLRGKQISGLHDLSSMELRHNPKTTNKNGASPMWQQKRPLTASPAINIQTSNLHTTTGSANTVACNQLERQCANIFNKHLIGHKAPETPNAGRQIARAGASTPQGYQAITPVVNRNLARTPSSIKTPKTRKFPGPAGLLPKLSPGQNLDDPSFAPPLPTARKPSPVQSKVSQSSSSEDEDFSRDPWTYMYQDFLKNVPLPMRYTIIRIYTEAIQQRLEHGKVPCLCALVKAFSLTEADASVLLKDPTGEIHGTLHRKVLENYQSELAPGAGLILKHVSVFSPAPTKHYLNITPGNILQIYPPDPQNMSSSQALASQCTQADGKRNDQRGATKTKAIIEQVDCNKHKNNLTEESNEKSWAQEDCFEDLFDSLDDDEDFLDDALLV